MKIIFLFAAIVCYASVHAQTVPPPPPPPFDPQNSRDTVGIFDKVDFEASYPGGLDAWRKYLEKNFKVDSVSDLVWKDLSSKIKKKGYYEATAIVQFIVCKDGTVCNIQTINNVPKHFRIEAERLIAESQKWEPAKQNGQEVKAYRKQPITLVIASE